MATLPVKWYDWRFHGLDGMMGVPGAFTNILDAVLVNGFGDTNVVTINVVNKRATFLLEDGVTFMKRSVVRVRGFNDPTLNGEYRVEDSDQGKIVLEIDKPDGPLEFNNKDIIVQYAPLGWFKPFSGVNKGIYKPSAPDALNWMFYMDDTTATYADVRIMEGARSIDDHIDSVPRSGVSTWFKAYAANTVLRPWAIIGDPYCFYYKANKTYNDISISSTDINLVDSGHYMFVGEGVRQTNKMDNFAVYLTRNGVTNSRERYTTRLWNSGHNRTLRLANGLKGDSLVNVSVSPNLPFMGINNFFSVDSVVYLSTENFFVGDDFRVTRMPGYVSIKANLLYGNFGFFIDAKDNSLNRELIFTCCHDSNDNGNTNRSMQFFFDITGPWR